MNFVTLAYLKMCIRDRANTEVNIEVQETQPTYEMEVATNNTLENQQEGTPPEMCIRDSNSSAFSLL